MKKGGMIFSSKFGQVTIFIIIAVLIIAGVALFFSLKGNLKIGGLPSSLEPVYDSFLDCVEEQTSVGVGLLGVQGGRIYLPEYDKGSEYRPFSSYFDFLGNAIPYWYYVSGSGLEKEQVPSISDMENDLEVFIEDRVKECSFDFYNEQGYLTFFGEEVEAIVTIRDKDVEVNLDLDFNLVYFNDTATVSEHNLKFESDLGSLYNSAREIYDNEQETYFLENYGIDVLRLYAPVDGVELTCSPKVWVGEEIVREVLAATEANVLSLKSIEGDYELTSEDDKYFVIDVDVPHDVRFLHSQSWPYFFEMAPTEDNLLIAEPVGNQQGLGALGFCYVPYHFIYDYGYPVLIQVMSGEELFQFPTTVIIRGTKPREPMEGAEAIGSEYPQICEQSNTALEVNVYDSQSNPVDAKVYFECAGVSCNAGEVSASVGTIFVPQCVNGFIVAKAEGYEEDREMITTVDGGFVNLYMNKLYSKEISFELDGRTYSGNAIITFVGEENSRSILYPEQTTVELSAGQYEVQARVYDESEIKIGPTSTETCTEVPREGIVGLFGLTEEKCYTIETPEQMITTSLAGGGNQNYYVLEEELINSNVVKINAPSLPTPNSLEKIQENMILVEEKRLEVSFE